MPNANRAAADRRRAVFLLLPAIVLGALSSLACADARTAERGAAGFQDLHASWVDAAETFGIPGMAIAIITADGKVQYDVFGLRDIERKLPVRSSTRFYIASCTKPFVAEATRMLAEKGALDLDAPVKRYLPRFEVADPEMSRTLTVRDLLSHRKGLASWPITFGEAFTGQMTEDRYYRLLGRVQPENQFHYSNLHFTLTGRVLEAVTGKSWKTVLQEEVFAPAGMTRTTCSATLANADQDVATGYRLRGGKPDAGGVKKTDETMHAAGGMFSTVEDLARWLQLQLGDGAVGGRRVWSEAVVRDVRQPQVKFTDKHPLDAEQSRTGWGLGWELRDFHGVPMVTHGGHYEGDTAYMTFVPDRHVGVAIVANAGDPSMYVVEAIGAQIFERLLGIKGPNLVERAVGAVGKLSSRREEFDSGGEGPPGPSRPSAAYVGRFVDDDWGTLEVYGAGKELKARIGNLPVAITWTGPDAFDAGDGRHGTFIVDANGAVSAVRLGMPSPDTATFERR